MQEGGANVCIMGTVTHELMHTSASQPPGVSIATAKRVSSTRAVLHRRVGHQGGVGKCSVSDVDEDQLQQVIFVDAGQPASMRAMARY
jgi:hypothetical protein